MNDSIVSDLAHSSSRVARPRHEASPPINPHLRWRDSDRLAERAIRQAVRLSCADDVFLSQFPALEGARRTRDLRLPRRRRLFCSHPGSHPGQPPLRPRLCVRGLKPADLCRCTDLTVWCCCIHCIAADSGQISKAGRAAWVDVWILW